MISRIQNRTCVLTKDFHVVIEETTKEFLSYFEFTLDSIIDFVYEKDKEKFIEFINETTPGRSLIIRLLRNTNEYKYNLITVLDDYESGKKRIKILEIDEVMEKNYMLYTESRFLRRVLSISGEYMFHYDSDTNVLQIINYADDNRIVISEMDLDRWVDYSITQGYFPEEERENLLTLVYNFKQLPASFSLKLKSAIRTGGSLMEDIRFMGVFHEDIGQQKRYVVGRILSEKDIKSLHSSQNLIGELQIDPLTKIYNRKTILNYAKQKIKSTSTDPFALCIIDLDNFKPINDQYGHMVGDKVLVRAAAKIKEVIGDDGVVGRIGGDEFMVVLNYVDNVQILRGILRAVLVQLRREFEGNFEGINITCSIGTAVYPTNAADYDELFQKADYCLYRAKDKGRDRYIFFRDDLHAEEYENFIAAKNSGQKTDRREIKELRYMTKFVQSLTIDREKAIIEIFKHILGTYGVDCINVYYGPEMKRVFSVGTNLPAFEEASYALSKDFRIMLKNEKFIKIDFKSDFPKDGEFLDALNRRKICSTIQAIIGTPEEIRGLVTFDKIITPSQWADYEINCVRLVSNVLELINFKGL